jgi:hypothetical protein
VRYVGQCDLVRRASASNEVKWQAMMGCAEPVSMRTFLAAVDITPLLDEGETIKGFVRDAQRSDPTTAAFRSWWGPDRCWFLQTAGYEFIFLA